MILTEVLMRKISGTSMIGLGITPDPSDPLGVIVQAGSITLADNTVLTVSNDTVMKIRPNPTFPLIAIISLTQNDGLVLNEWPITPSGVYQAYEGSVFCDIAKFDIPPGCTDLANVAVTVPVVE